MSGKLNNNITVPIRPKTSIKDDTTIILITPTNYKMKSYGPKPLLKLFTNITLLEYQIQTLKHVFPSSDILLCIGEESDKLLKYKNNHLRIIENQLHEQTNEVEYVRLAFNAVTTDKVIIINSDVVFDREVLKFLKSERQSCLIYDTKGKMKESEIGITIVNNIATIFSYKIPNKWCNIISLVGQDLDLMRNICADKTRKRHYLFEAINVLLDKRKIKACEVLSSKLYRIENSKDLERIQNEITHLNI